MQRSICTVLRLVVHLFLFFRVKAIFYGCANDKFGGCGSVGNMSAIMAKLGKSTKHPILCNLFRY
jgi:hypothetical protein